jgi:protein-L-isoaspartate(D-aspartate) O-methyltransferase
LEQDTYRHKGLRKKLIDSLRRKGIHDESVLRAMESIPRHCFLDRAFEEWAYRDVPFPIGNEQTISQPFTVAFQTELLKVKPKMKVLEIGTGSGYQASVLAEMGAKVYSIERLEPLFQKAQEILKELGYLRVRCFLGDGYSGLPRFAPFDRILVTAGAEEIPQLLLSQLTVGGILVIPVGIGDTQDMLRITKTDEDTYELESFGQFRFVPFLRGTEDNADS